jgi:hypothetical protein
MRESLQENKDNWKIILSCEEKEEIVILKYSQGCVCLNGFDNSSYFLLSPVGMKESYSEKRKKNQVSREETEKAPHVQTVIMQYQ